MQKDFRNFISGCLSVVSFVSFLTKVMSERTISLGVGYDKFAFGIVVMVSKFCTQLTVFSVGGERLCDNLADVGLCRC